MAGVNKVIIDIEDRDEFTLYISGKSITDIFNITGIPISTLRNRFLKAGILRNRGDAVRLAFSQGKIPSNRGKKRFFTQQHKDNISKSRREKGKMTAEGIDIHKGYARFTRGEHKGRLVHIVVMEKRIGRALKTDECVHHIDGDKLNNDVNNLALLTVSAHARLHRFQDKISGNNRQRDELGRFL